MAMKKREIVFSEEGLKPHLPEDLWPEILSRLPVKSLLRFCCVSKVWHSLINDAGFCRLHLKNFKNNRDETRLLVLEGQERNCVLRSSDSFETNEEAPLHTVRKGFWDVQCYIDGLAVLMSVKRVFLECSKLRVWNPSIKKFHDIPPLPEFKEGHANTLLREEEIGLGYDPLLKDYKYVKLIFNGGDTQSPFVAVYTVGTRSWRIVPSQLPVMNGKTLACLTTMKTVYLQGSLHFVVVKLLGVKSLNEMFSFDLTSEVFSYTSFPDCGGPLTLADNGHTLAVFDFKRGAGAMWVLDSSNTVSEPKRWTKRYSFCLEVPEEPEFLYLKKNGDVLLWWGKKTQSLQQCSGTVSSYNLETKKEEVLLQEEGLEGHCQFYFRYVCGYIESLNLLN